MRLPHKRFIQTLMVGKKLPEQIDRILNKYGLPVIADYTGISADIVKVDPDFASGKEDKISQEALKKLNIESMYGRMFSRAVDPDIAHLDTTFKMLDWQEIKVLLYACLVAGIHPEEIELIINEKFDINASPESVDAFIHYFFDLSDFTRKERYELEEKFALDLTEKRSINHALKKDKDHMLWKLGVNPDRSYDSMLKEMFSDSFYLFKEKSKTQADMAIKFGTLAVRLSDRIDRVIQAEDKSKSFFDEIDFNIKESEDIQAPTPEDLDVELEDKFMKVIANEKD